MFKSYVTTALTILLLATGFSSNIEASVKKHKKKSAKLTYSKSSKKKSLKYLKKSKSRRRHVSSVDLRVLTTESPYTESPANGVNPVETKPGIQ